METVTQHQYESRLDTTSEPTAGNSSAWVKQHEPGCFSSTAAARGDDAGTELGDSLRSGVVASWGIWQLTGELNPQPTDPDAASPGRDPSHPLPRLIYRAQSEARERSVCCLCRDPVLQGLHRVMQPDNWATNLSVLPERHRFHLTSRLLKTSRVFTVRGQIKTFGGEGSEPV